MNIIRKKCTVCGIVKELSEYNKQKLGKNGRRANCRLCQNKWNKAWKKTDSGKESIKKYKKSQLCKEASKRYRENNKQKIKEYGRTEVVKNKKKIYSDKIRFGGNRALVLARDNYACVICKSDEQIQVHHKDRKGRNKKKSEQNNDIDNLITLCSSCHIKQHNPVLHRWNQN